ncbi:hypothetical protein [Halococcus sp. AFM35]|uniref:hypothetical protein n=1 Tax=Halococcus sp. AFM35 TaxID=3421653 RepID=UPI003EBFFDB2
MSEEPDSPREGWSSKRREIIYRELRDVLDTQQSVMDDIDDKALRTVRITAVLLGVVVPAAGLAAVTFQPLLAAVGVFALVGSAVVGVLTYGESDLVVGPSGEYAVSLATGEGEDWELDFLVELASWTESNAVDIANNGRLLFYTQALFVVGIVALTASMAFYPVMTYLTL